MRSGSITSQSYKNHCTAMQDLLRIAREEYYYRKSKSLGKNSKKNFRLLNSLMNKTKSRLWTEHIVLDEKNNIDRREMANKCNEYFISHPRDLNTNIPQSDKNYVNFIPKNDATMQFYYSTPDEIRIIIKI